MLGLDELGRCNTMQYKSRGAIAILVLYYIIFWGAPPLRNSHRQDFYILVFSSGFLKTFKGHCLLLGGGRSQI